MTIHSPVIAVSSSDDDDNGSQQQQRRRELLELRARADADESGALKLPSLGDLAGLASIVGGGVDIFHSLFSR